MGEIYNEQRVVGVRDLAATYRRAAAVSADPGNAVAINTGTAGTVTLTLALGGSVIVTVPVGTTILPFGVTGFAVGTATGATAQSLYAAA